MDHREQINEFQKKLNELIDWFAKEFTEITYASIIGVLTITIIDLKQRNQNK